MDLSPLFNNNKFNKNNTDFYSDYDQLLMNEEKIGSTSPEKLSELKFLNKKTEKKKEKRKKINNKGNKNKKSKKNIKDKKDIIKIKKHTKYDIISMNFGNIDFDSKVNIGNNELKSNKSTKNLSFDNLQKVDFESFSANTTNYTDNLYYLHRSMLGGYLLKNDENSVLLFMIFMSSCAIGKYSSISSSLGFSISIAIDSIFINLLSCGV